MVSARYVRIEEENRLRDAGVVGDDWGRQVRRGRTLRGVVVPVVRKNLEIYEYIEAR
jgi:hypothetical protein